VPPLLSEAIGELLSKRLISLQENLEQNSKKVQVKTKKKEELVFS